MTYRNCNSYVETTDELKRMVKVNQKLSIEKAELRERITELQAQIAFKIKECQTLSSACTRRDATIRNMYVEMEFKGDAK